MSELTKIGDVTTVLDGSWNWSAILVGHDGDGGLWVTTESGWSYSSPAEKMDTWNATGPLTVGQLVEAIDQLPEATVADRGEIDALVQRAREALAAAEAAKLAAEDVGEMDPALADRVAEARRRTVQRNGEMIGKLTAEIDDLLTEWGDHSEEIERKKLILTGCAIALADELDLPLAHA